MQKLRNEIELWDRVVKRHEGVATSRTIIRRLARRCGRIHEIESLSAPEATEELKKAHHRYKNAKPESQIWRTEHLHGLADALADHTSIRTQENDNGRNSTAARTCSAAVTR